MIVGWFQGYKQKTKHPTGERLEKRKKKMKETEAQAKLSLKLQAYQYLKTKILNCEYRPNEFLNEQKLCAEMGNISGMRWAAWNRKGSSPSCPRRA